MLPIETEGAVMVAVESQAGELLFIGRPDLPSAPSTNSHGRRTRRGANANSRDESARLGDPGRAFLLPSVFDRVDVGGEANGARQCIAEGHHPVLDPVLEKFFDRVNHDRQLAAVAARVADKRTLKLIRAFLEAGVMEDGLVSLIDEGNIKIWHADRHVRWCSRGGRVTSPYADWGGGP